MKKKWGIITLLVLGLSLSLAYALEDEWGVITIPKGESIHLGFAAALTGDYASPGLDERNGMLLALEERDEEVLGFKVEVLVEDDQCRGLPALAIAEKFRVDPLFVGLIGHMCSLSSIPASKTYEKYGISMISPSTTAAEYTDRGMRNVFRTCFNDAIQGRVGAEYAVNVLKLKTVVVLHDSTSYGRPIAETFKNTFESLGGNVLAFEGIFRGHKDFRLILSKIKPMMPQLVYFGGMAAEGALIVRQMREIGMQNAYFMSDDGCYNIPDFVEAAGKAANGAYITFTQPKEEQYEAWEKRFMERFGNKPIAFAPQAYDATMAMLMAIEIVGNLQDDGGLLIGKKALADTIRSLEFEGPAGKVGFTDTGDSRSKVVVWQVQSQEFVIASGQDETSEK